ncbi:MAG: tetratricopeptide repeat protein [Bradymonadaceae bacterium]|nr:tetratricopeptide repeat protein [Lujinxingiaceae bacterium]
MIRCTFCARTLRALLAASLLLAGVASAPSPVHAQDWSVDGGDQRRQEIVDRYKSMLESNPTEGMAFNRVLEYVGRARGLDRLIDEYRTKVTNRPDRANLRLVLGHFLRVRGDNEEALLHYEKAVELAPTMPLAWLSRGKVLMLIGKRADATNDFEKALELERNRESQQEILRQLADLSFASRDYERAEKYFDRLVALEPRNEFLRMEYAQALVQYKRYEKAVAQYEAVLKLVGGNQAARATTLRDMADVYEQMGQDDKALDTYRQVTRLVRDGSWLSREVQGRVVNIYRRQDRLNEYIETVAARWSAGDFDEMMLLADMYQEVGRIDDALRLYQRAAGRNARSVDPRLKIIRILERRGDDKEIVTAYEGLIRIAPTRYQYHFDLVRHFFRMGERTRALRVLEEVGRRFARDSHVQVMLADQYTRYDMSDKALAIYERLVRQEPKNDSFILSLGEFYFQNGERQKAVDTWKKLVGSQLGTVEGHARLGEVLVDRGMVELGIGHFEKAVELAPNDVRIQRGLAQAYERARLWDKAIVAWTTLLDGATQPHMAAEGRSRIIEIYRRQNRLRAKMREFAAQFEARPPEVRAGYFLAESHIKLQEVEPAEVIYRRILELERAAGKPALEALLALEKIYTQRGEFEKALGVLEELAAAMPDLARDFYHRMADLSVRMQADDQAVKYASRALDENPDDAAAHARLGEVYHNMRQLEDAARQYRTAIELDPRAYPVYISLAEIVRQLGDLREAEQLYRTVARQSPDDSLVVVVARKAMDLAHARGRLEEMEAELHPMLFRNPPRPVYRKLLVELYGRMTTPLIAEARYASGARQEKATSKLEQIGARAMPVLLDALLDNDVSQRVMAMQMLGDLGLGNAAASIARLIEDPAEPLRVPAAIAAAHVGDARATDSLVRALDDAEPGIRDVATWALGHTGGKGAVNRLARVLADGENINQQSLAAISLGRIGSREAVDVLLLTLSRAQSSGYSNTLALATVWALGQAADPKATDALAQVMHEAPEAVAAMAVLGLVQIGERAATEALFEAYWSAPDALRHRAGSGLAWAAARHDQAKEARLATSSLLQEVRHIEMRRGAIRVENLLEYLVRSSSSIVAGDSTAFLASHKDAIVRIAARRLAAGGPGARLVSADLFDEASSSLALGIITSASASDAESLERRAEILAAIVAGLHPALKSRARADGADVDPALLRLLGTIGQRDDLALVSAHVGHASPQVRRAAVLALAGFGTVAAATTLQVAALEDSHHSVRSAAATSLGRSIKADQGHAEAVEKIVKLTEDRYVSVRLAAIEALGRSRATVAVGALQSMLATSTQPVQAAILDALDRIDTDESRAARSGYDEQWGMKLRRSGKL